MKPTKTHFASMALSATILILVSLALIVGVILFWSAKEGELHSYKLDRLNWEKKQEESVKLNDFWQALGGRMKPKDKGDTLLASDLRHILIEPSSEPALQLEAMRRLARGTEGYPELSTAVSLEVGLDDSDKDWPIQELQRKIDLVKQDKVDELLVKIAPPPDPKDPKYDYDFWQEVLSVFTRDRVLGGWFAISLLVALAVRLFESKGWWEWGSEDAFFKIWLVVILLPAVALWVLTILVWGIVSSPVQLYRLATTWRKRKALEHELESHPHYEHIRTLRAVIAGLEAQLDRAQRDGWPTTKIEEQLTRARQLRQSFIDLPALGEDLGASTRLLDAMIALRDALAEVEQS